MLFLILKLLLAKVSESALVDPFISKIKLCLFVFSPSKEFATPAYMPKPLFSVTFQLALTPVVEKFDPSKF
ncbi:hypothetical protein IJF81_01185 [bacterium]|nr:hypothetical protein [bacterium]